MVLESWRRFNAYVIAPAAGRVETGTQLESITRPIPGRIFGAVLFSVEKRTDTNCSVSVRLFGQE